MKRILLASAALALCGSLSNCEPAFAQNVPTQTLPSGVTRPAIASTDLVYPGCPKPPTTFGNVWYFDPVNGKTPAAYEAMTPPVPFPTAGQPATSAMQGSAAHPWSSVASLFGVKINGQLSVVPGYPSLMLSTVYNSGGPIRPGDELLLMSGNYGALGGGGLSVAASEIINSPALTFAPASGQTPVFESIAFAGTSGIVMHDITVTSHNPAAALVNFEDAGIAGSTNTDIVLYNMTVSSDTEANVDTWTQAQWVANEALVGVAFQGNTGGAGLTCASITNSHVWGANQDIWLFADNSLAQNNETDHFTDDGFDYGASQLAIINNHIHDPVNDGVGQHVDGIQGEEPSGPNPPATPNVQPEKGIYEARNLVVDIEDTANKFPSYLQAIDAHDGDWTNVLSEENIVITSSCHGIDLESTHNGAILNNTILDTGIAAYESGCNPEVIVTTTHEGSESNNVLISGNIAPGINFDGAPDVLAKNNVAYGTAEPAFHYCSSAACTAAITEGLTVGVVAPAVTPTGNVLDGKGPANEFTSIVAPYNLALLPGAPGLIAGPSLTAAGAVAPISAPPTLPPAWRSPTLALVDVSANGEVTLIGTATGGSPVTVYAGSAAPLGSVTTGPNFVWTFTTLPLAAGTYSFTATETDPGPTAPSAPSVPLVVTVP